MQYRRLVIEEGDTTFSLGFHPSLTVVAGLEAPARKGLVSELVGGLSSGRSGVNLEVTDDRGRSLAVLRPASSGHRVIDLGSGTDVSEEFRAPDGRIDLLGRYGLAPTARTALHLDRDALQSSAQQDAAVGRLAGLDQTELWSAAARVRITEDELQAIGEETRTSAEDAELVAKIEHHHHTLELALDQLRKLRRDASMVSSASLLAALVVALVDPTMSAAILAIGLITILLSFVFRARVEAMQRMEKKALAAAGVESYLGYVVGRVNDLMDDTEARRRRLAVAEDHRAAAQRWTQLVGDVSVTWALAHHEEIETAARLRRELAQVQQGGSAAPLDAEAMALAQSLIGHLSRMRTVGAGSEAMPLILDDPFTGLDPTTKVTLMELLARSAGSPQVILLTGQDEVAAWARLEALTGDVAIVEPSVSTSRSATS